MSLQSYLENLRAKPEHLQKRFAYSVSFCVTAVIFAFWLSSFTTKVASSDVVATKVNNIDSPGQSLIAGVGSVFADIRDIFFGPKKVTFSNNVVVKPGKN